MTDNFFVIVRSREQKPKAPLQSVLANYTSSLSVPANKMDSSAA